ncbi:MAG: T9SS type A sorting domain-containing protein [Ignavibacteriaceae bacterium]
MQKNKVTLRNEFVPSEFFLSQNYPNPFKDKTTIKYCLSEKTKVELSLFNSNGEKVKELFNNVQNAGTYETVLDSQDYPAGD